MSETAITHGLHHLGLTVPDLAATKAFFVDTLGFRQVGEKPDYPMSRASVGRWAHVEMKLGAAI